MFQHGKLVLSTRPGSQVYEERDIPFVYAYPFPFPSKSYYTNSLYYICPTIENALRLARGYNDMIKKFDQGKVLNKDCGDMAS